MKRLDYKSIPKFPHCNNTFNVQWEYISEWIEENAKFMKVELDPPFQRGYVWTKQQQIDWLEFIMKKPKSGMDIYWNCPGWLKGNDWGPMQLVDGRQRLKAIEDFLEDKIEVFGGYTYRQIDNFFFTDKLLTFHINNLESQKEVVEWYLGMNTGGTVHSKEDLKSAYEYLNQLNGKIS